MTTVTQDAAGMILDIEDIVASMADGVAALTVIGDAMIGPEPQTAAHKALVFVTKKLIEDVETIGDAIHTLRQLRPANDHDAA